MTRQLRPVFAAVLALGVSGCRLEAESAMHRPIEMGPFTFIVEDAWKEPHSPCDAIIVALSLEESRGAKVHFDEFLNDMTTRKMIASPNVAIVDPDGHRTTGVVTRVSGRESWRAEFQPDEGKRWGDGGQPNARQATTVCGNWRAPDFRFVVTNPDRRSGQSSRVSVPLR